MKKVALILSIVVVFFISNAITAYIAYRAGLFVTFHRISNLNQQHTEQIKFLVSSIDKGLSADEKEFKQKISNFNSDYHISYEGQPFMRLAKKYFHKSYNDYSFIYQNYLRPSDIHPNDNSSRGKLPNGSQK